MMYSDNLYEHEQCKESDVRLLIEFPENGYNCDIIHSSEVIQQDQILPGNTIDVRYGSSVLKAEIYTTSADKHFLEYEMHDLNLTKVSERLEKQNQKLSGYKRRKLTQSRLESRIEYKPNSSISGLLSPTWSNSTSESMHFNVENQTTFVIPPMTLEQGTQTSIEWALDGGSTQSKNLSKIVQRLESLMLENQETQKIMSDNVEEIKQELDNNNESSNQIANWNTAQINNNICDANNRNILHSNFTQNNDASDSIMTSNELTFNYIPMDQVHESSSYGEENHSPFLFSNNAQHKWNDIDEITIGSYGSKIRRNSLVTIFGLTSYSHATRKLLNLLFSKEVLATHSLSGRSSPAHTLKPPKKQLDTLIVADIVEFVTEKFKVAEKDVRSAITTKCSDENRISKKEKSKKTIKVKQNNFEVDFAT